MVRVGISYNSNVLWKRMWVGSVIAIFKRALMHNALQKHKAQPQGSNHHLSVCNNRIQVCWLNTGGMVGPLASLKSRKTTGRKKNGRQGNVETPSFYKTAWWYSKAEMVTTFHFPKFLTCISNCLSDLGDQ